MSYMQRIEGEILDQLELLTDGDVKIDETVAWIKKEILDSYKRGVATKEYNTKRKMTFSKEARQVIAKL